MTASHTAFAVGAVATPANGMPERFMASAVVAPMAMALGCRAPAAGRKEAAWCMNDSTAEGLAKTIASAPRARTPQPRAIP